MAAYAGQAKHTWNNNMVGDSKNPLQHLDADYRHCRSRPCNAHDGTQHVRVPTVTRRWFCSFDSSNGCSHYCEYLLYGWVDCGDFRAPAVERKGLALRSYHVERRNGLFDRSMFPPRASSSPLVARLSYDEMKYKWKVGDSHLFYNIASFRHCE